MKIDCEIILKILSIIGIIVLLISLNFKISNFLNIKNIFKDYFKTFNGNYLQLIAIYIMTLFICLNIALKKQVTKDALESINLIITVFTSMFFAITSILCSIDFSKKKEKYKLIVEETFNSTLFEIICCIILLLISFITIFRNSYIRTWELILLSAMIYYFMIIITLNILLILKRIKMIFEKNIKN